MKTLWLVENRATRAFWAAAPRDAAAPRTGIAAAIGGVIPAPVPRHAPTSPRAALTACVAAIMVFILGDSTDRRSACMLLRGRIGRRIERRMPWMDKAKKAHIACGHAGVERMMLYIKENMGLKRCTPPSKHYIDFTDYN